MATEDEIDNTIEALAAQIDEVAGDSRKWSQTESVDIYKGLISHCREWAETISREIEDILGLEGAET